MEITDLDLKPKDVDEADWEAYPPGARLRVVRDHQYELELTARQYEALARLPYWMLYGPEHGAPREWFNPEGYLLPKYRPGGPRFPELLDRRRRYRGRRLLLHLLREGRVRHGERYKTEYELGSLIVLMAEYVGIFLLVRAWWGGEVPGWVWVVQFVVVLALYGGSVVLFVVLRGLVPRWILEARWRRRVERLEPVE